jgi:hypothetical protein
MARAFAQVVKWYTRKPASSRQPARWQRKPISAFPDFRPAIDQAFGECKADKSWALFENTSLSHSVMIDGADWLTGILLQPV